MFWSWKRDDCFDVYGDKFDDENVDFGDEHVDFDMHDWSCSVDSQIDRYNAIQRNGPLWGKQYLDNSTILK